MLSHSSGPQSRPGAGSGGLRAAGSHSRGPLPRLLALCLAPPSSSCSSPSSPFNIIYSSNIKSFQGRSDFIFCKSSRVLCCSYVPVLLHDKHLSASGLKTALQMTHFYVTLVMSVTAVSGSPPRSVASQIPSQLH